MAYFSTQKKIPMHIDGPSKAIASLCSTIFFRSSGNVKSKCEDTLANQKPDKLADLTHNKMPSGAFFFQCSRTVDGNLSRHRLERFKTCTVLMLSAF